MVRELQPDIIVNDRLDLLDVEGGLGIFTTPEQYKVSKWPEKKGIKVPWETCQTFSRIMGVVTVMKQLGKIQNSYWFINRISEQRR